MKKILKPLTLLIVLVLGSLGVLGCTGGATPTGWSGVVVSDDAMFLGSMGGKLVALSTANGAHLEGFTDYAVTSSVTSGFGCSQSTAAVPIYGTPVVTGELVYFTGYNGKVYALNAVSGALRWVYPREGSLQQIVGGVAVSDGIVYFAAADGTVYALDAETGDRKWELAIGSKVWSTPVVSGDIIYIGSFDKKLYAINSDGTRKWEFATEGAIVSSPQLYNSTVYVGTFDRHIYAINSDGSLKWKSDFIAGKWFWAGLVVNNGTIYAPGLDGMVYVVNAATGEKIAESDLGAPVSSSPVTIGSLVIVVTENGVVYSIDTGNNQARVITALKTTGGKDEVVEAPLCAAGGVVYVHTQTQSNEAVYAINPETGQTLWSMAIR